MKVIDVETNEALMWLRYVLNPDTEMPLISEWPALLAFAKKQAMTGLFLPDVKPPTLPKDILLQWIGQVQLIEQQNKLLNKQVIILSETLKTSGIRYCILKGQGNALLYPAPKMRSPGDIDVWVDLDEETMLRYVNSVYPEAKASFKHIKFPMFKDTPVDMHHTPLKIYHPIHNRRLQQWLNENKEEQMTHYMRLPETEKGIAIPTVRFNAVYQLGHIMIHLEDEGIGLRQFVDYYYVLKHLNTCSKEEREEIVTIWSRLGMKKLASAVMWVEKELLGIQEEYLLVVPDKRKGLLLAKDILEGGNFGHHSEREQYRRYGVFTKKLSNAWHMLKLSTCFPGDAFFRLLTKMKNGCKIVVNNW